MARKRNAKLVSDVRSFADADRFLGNKSKRKIANNTWLVRTDNDEISAVLHRCAIVVWTLGGSIRLSSCQYSTRTTKSRINSFLPPGFSLAQKDYDWLLSVPTFPGHKTIPFIDGMDIGDMGLGRDFNPLPGRTGTFGGCVRSVSHRRGRRRVRDPEAYCGSILGKMEYPEENPSMADYEDPEEWAATMREPFEPYRGSGKFEGEPRIIEALYAMTPADDEISDEAIGWYGLLLNVPTTEGVYSFIVHEDTQGFFEVEALWEQAEQAQSSWDDLVEEIEGIIEEAEEVEE